MPLVGGGGAPNVSGGANPAGTGTSLNYIGKHAYAFSGLFVCSSNAQTVLKFTTGAEYLVGEFQVNAGYDDDNATEAATATTGQIKLDGQGIGIIGCGGATPDRRPSSVQQKVILAPFTSVECIMHSETEGDKFMSMTFVGEIH
jgi:hypothetical protein